MENLNIDNHMSLRDLVFNSLRDDILIGKLSPGERIFEKQLAEKIGVSRTPIREALRRLKIEGLIEIIPRKGAHVAFMSAKDIENILEIRSALEVLAVRLCCLNITDTQLQDIYLARDAFYTAAQDENVTEMAENDEKFHMLILASTNNNMLFQIINNLKEQIFRYRFAYLKDKIYRNIIQKEHAELVDAIAEKNIELAENIIKRHIKNQEKAIKKNIVL